MKDDLITFIGGISLGILFGIKICEWDERARRKKKMKKSSRTA